MSRRKHHPGDPTAERTADQSTQSASGLGGGEPAPGSRDERDREAEDVLNRNRGERYETPRRYEEDERRRDR